MKRRLSNTVLSLTIGVLLGRYIVRRKRITKGVGPMLCAQGGCKSKAKGYDIEKAFDVDQVPVYAVYYECTEGHRFVAEYDRVICITDEDLEACA